MRNIAMQTITRLCDLPSDKYLHLLACQVIAYFISFVCSLFLGKWIGGIIGFVASVTVGFFKELRDDTFDYEDFKFDIIGAITGATYFLI